MLLTFVNYIIKKVHSEWSQKERLSLYSNIFTYSCDIYSLNVSLASRLVRLALEAGMTPNELIQWSNTVPTETVLGFIAKQAVKLKDRDTHLNLVLFLLFKNAVAIPVLTEKAKK